MYVKKKCMHFRSRLKICKAKLPSFQKRSFLMGFVKKHSKKQHKINNNKFGVHSCFRCRLRVLSFSFQFHNRGACLNIEQVRILILIVMC